ncbi:MAG: purine-nucleoside phosphorylase [Deltaproteobacteria bacterium]|nr:purine-nucleoside phosphorylase [Deltaproteobacteria bacterium]
MPNLQAVNDALAYLQRRIPSGFTPQVGLTLGTGLGLLAEEISVAARIPYQEIPGFPVSTVESHEGALVLGELGGRPVAALSGRFHLYEGYSPQEVTLPVRVLAGLGLTAFFFSNAAGGLVTSWQAGRVMLVTDHINFTGQNPLAGPNVDAWGERFPDMSQAYDPGLAGLAREVAGEQGIQLYQGVYVGLKGPSMETPAETRMLGILGAQAVGMSTVLEVIAARHHGLKVLAFSAIANINDPDNMQPAPLDLVIANATAAGGDLSRIILGVLQKM